MDNLPSLPFVYHPSIHPLCCFPYCRSVCPSIPKSGKTLYGNDGAGESNLRED